MSHELKPTPIETESKPATAWRTIATFMPAGMKYYAPPEYASLMHQGDPISLRRELSNPHDVFALELLWKMEEREVSKIGYVPRPLNQAIVALLQAGPHVEVRTSIFKDASAEIIIKARFNFPT